MRIVRDPLTMCKFFFSLSFSLARKKLKTPPHNPFVYVICVFFLGEPENPFLWYPRNRGRDLDFFLIFSPQFFLFPAYVVPPWVHNPGSLFSFPSVFFVFQHTCVIWELPSAQSLEGSKSPSCLFPFSSLYHNMHSLFVIFACLPWVVGYA